MTRSDPTVSDTTVSVSTADTGGAAPTVAPPAPLAEVLARAVLVVTGTVQRDPATGRRSLRVDALLRGDRDDLALLTRLPVPDEVDRVDGADDVVLVVGDGTAPGSPPGAPAGPYLLADPRHIDIEQVRRVLAGLPALAPLDGSPDELAAAADLVLVGGPTGATRPAPASEGGPTAEAQVQVEVLVRELLAARPGALGGSDLAGRPVGPALAVDDRPRLWVTVEAAVADRFRHSIPGLWFVAVGEGGGLRSLTRSTPEQFLEALRPLRARLRATAAESATGGDGGR